MTKQALFFVGSKSKFPKNNVFILLHILFNIFFP